MWDAWVKCPTSACCMTSRSPQNYIVFYVIPLKIDDAQIEHGGIHWSWCPGEPTYFGLLPPRRRRQGHPLHQGTGAQRHACDGRLRRRQEACSSTWRCRSRIPSRSCRCTTAHAGIRSRARASITRLSVDLSKKMPKDYSIEVLYPESLGALPRQDDRYNTAHYRYGFLSCPIPIRRIRPSVRHRAGALRRADAHLAALIAPRGRAAAGGLLRPEAARPHPRATATSWVSRPTPPRTVAPISSSSTPSTSTRGPIATVKLPTRIVGQIHGWWVPAATIPKKA